MKVKKVLSGLMCIMLLSSVISVGAENVATQGSISDVALKGVTSAEAVLKNVALGKNVTVSGYFASSVTEPSAWGCGAMLVDGIVDGNSEWISEDDQDVFAVIDLASEYLIQSIDIVNRLDYDDVPISRYFYDVELSNDQQNWCNVGFLTEDPGHATTVTYDNMPMQKYRYVRVKDNHFMRFAEIMVNAYDDAVFDTLTTFDRPYNISHISAQYDNPNQTVTLYMLQDLSNWVNCGTLSTTNGTLSFDAIEQKEAGAIRLVAKSGEPANEVCAYGVNVDNYSITDIACTSTEDEFMGEEKYELISQGKTVTATTEGFGTLASSLTNGNLRDIWASLRNSGDDMTSLVIDLEADGAERHIRKIEVFARRDDAGALNDGCRCNYEIQLSNDQSFSEYYTVGSQLEDPGIASVATFKCNPGENYQYMRLIGKSDFVFGEIKVYSIIDGAAAMSATAINMDTADENTIMQANYSTAESISVLSKISGKYENYGTVFVSDGKINLPYVLFGSDEIKLVADNGEIPSAVKAFSNQKKAISTTETILENVSLLKPAEATSIWASTTGGGSAAAAVDGNKDTMWASYVYPAVEGLNSFSDMYVTIDLGDYYDIRKIEYTPRSIDPDGTDSELTLIDFWGSATADFSDKIKLADIGFDAVKDGATNTFDVLAKNQVRYVRVSPKKLSEQYSGLCNNGESRVFAFNEVSFYGVKYGMSSEISEKTESMLAFTGKYVNKTDDNAKAILAAYSDDGRLLGVSIEADLDFKADEANDVSIMAQLSKLNYVSGGTVKLFIWNMDGLSTYYVKTIE